MVNLCLDLGAGINLKMLFKWPEISHRSLSRSSRCNNDSSSLNPSSGTVAPRHLGSTQPVKQLISSYLNLELINSHSRRPCCCSASPSRETNQTMNVIESWNRWHYWILITSFHANIEHGNYLATRRVYARLCVCVTLCIGRGWSPSQTTGSSGSCSGWKKVVSGYQRTQPCLDGSLLSQPSELLPYGGA